MCTPANDEAKAPICVLGDRHGAKMMVVYGDSHALMWLPAFNSIAMKAHWKMVMLAKTNCPAAIVSVKNPSIEKLVGQFTACDQWHQWVVRWINNHKPNMLVATQNARYGVPFSNLQSNDVVSATRWQRGFESLFKDITVPSIRKVLLGSTPFNQLLSPQCLTAHSDHVRVCSVATNVGMMSSYRVAQRDAAQRSGAEYIDPIPWFCSTTCTAIVGKYVVYVDPDHVTETYGKYLQTVLAGSLALNTQ
jgi:hypothetical protein